MNNFEAILLISPDTTTKNHNDFFDTFEKLITENGGLIIGKEEWGLRDLAYKINSLKKAFYFFYQIDIQGQKIQAIKKSISQNEKLIRYLFIKVKEHDTQPTKLVTENEK